VLRIGEGEIERLKKEVEKEKQRREWAEKNAETARKAEAIVRGKFKAQSERVKNGVCPCCNRTFQNLMAHMKTKHPGWK
jgi:rubrerythrin